MREYRIREMQGDVGRCREMQGDAGRCREMLNIIYLICTTYTFKEVFLGRKNQARYENG